MTAQSVASTRALRRRQPVTEVRVWRLLRNRRLGGLKFRRQVPIGPYVADFVCLRHRLVIEFDGPFHDPVADAARDAHLAALGYRVLRFANNEFGEAAVNRILAVTEAPLADDPWQ